MCVYTFDDCTSRLHMALWVYTGMHAQFDCSRPLQVDGGMCPTAITNSPVCCAMPWVEPPKYSCCWDLFWIPCEFFWCHSWGGFDMFDRLCSYQLIVTNPCSGGLTKGVMSEQTMIVSRVYTRESRRQSKASCPLRPSRKSWDLFYPWRVSQHLFPS